MNLATARCFLLMAADIKSVEQIGFIAEMVVLLFECEFDLATAR
jgi:hypothetical protein